MPMKKYLISAVKPCCMVFFPAILVVAAIKQSVHLHAAFLTFIFIVTTGAIILSIGLNKNERVALKTVIINKFMINEDAQG